MDVMLSIHLLQILHWTLVNWALEGNWLMLYAQSLDFNNFCLMTLQHAFFGKGRNWVTIYSFLMVPEFSLTWNMEYFTPFFCLLTPIFCKASLFLEDSSFTPIFKVRLYAQQVNVTDDLCSLLKLCFAFIMVLWLFFRLNVFYCY